MTMHVNTQNYSIQHENNHLKDFCHHSNESDRRIIDFI